MSRRRFHVSARVGPSHLDPDMSTGTSFEEILTNHDTSHPLNITQIKYPLLDDANMSRVISLAQCVPMRPLGPRFSRIHRNTIGTQWTVPTVPAIPQGHVSRSFHVELSGGSKGAKEH